MLSTVFLFKKKTSRSPFASLNPTLEKNEIQA